CLLGKNGLNRLNSPCDPRHHWNRHAVAQRAVSRPVSGWLISVGDERVVVRESLQSLALSRSESANGHAMNDSVLVISLKCESWIVRSTDSKSCAFAQRLMASCYLHIQRHRVLRASL